MAVNKTAWRRFPVAARDQGFKADDAIKRIQQAAKGSVETFNMAFLWRDSNGPPNNKNSYRLPVADILNGRFTLVPHAVFTAAAILSGAHGGLESVVGEEEKTQLRTVVGEIYKMLQDAYGDPRIVPPWERDDVPPQDRPNRQISETAALVASVNGSVASLPLADTSRSWDGGGARSRLWSWAGGDYRKYRRGFMWWDQSAPEEKGSYKLPVADVIDGKLTVVPRAVNAVAAVINGARGGVDIPEADMSRVAALVKRIQARFQDDDDGGGGETEATTAAGVELVKPPSEWFDNPNLSAPTRLTVTPEGRVYGHLALWNTCHMGIRDVCRMAPRSRTGYKYFMDGTVITADGRERPVGKITMGTGHASLNLGYVPAADHYDNTGTVVAIAAAYEDQFGPVVAGAAVPEASEAQLAMLRRSPLSGDWRPTPEGLELVAALAVNSPGFPVVGFTASGEPAALLAAGMVLSDEETAALGDLSKPDRDLLARLEAYERRAAELTQSSRRRRLDAVLSAMGGGSGGV